MKKQPFVRVRVVGGLGNQMFCAAAGMALADRLGARLEFGLDKICRLGQRNYELGIFRLPATLVEDEGWKFSKFATPLHLVRGLSGPRVTIWRQAGQHYETSFEQLEGSVYLRGFFQSPRYFESIAAKVRTAFDLAPHVSALGRDIAQSARGDDSVCLHVRRGDYLTAGNAAIFAMLGKDYYRRALERVHASTGASPLRLFVISDDIAAARELLGDYPGATFAAGTTAVDDMHLMSVCRHHIIANSSMSWWGAWLGPRPDGITVAPKAWFTGEKAASTKMDDMFPPSWQIV